MEKSLFLASHSPSFLIVSPASNPLTLDLFPFSLPLWYLSIYISVLPLYSLALLISPPFRPLPYLFPMWANFTVWDSHLILYIVLLIFSTQHKNVRINST